MENDALPFNAYVIIRESIIFCRYEPGRKLSNKQLEQELGVGRTPIREALVRLDQEKLVYTVPQSGTYVSKIDMHEAENARFAREQLERAVATECCARASLANLDRLSILLSKQTDAAANHDVEMFFRLDNLFHEELFSIVDRHDVWRWLETCNTNLERYRWLRIQLDTLDWNTILAQHHQLLAALQQRKPEEVDYLTAVHLHLMAAEQEEVMSSFPDYFKH